MSFLNAEEPTVCDLLTDFGIEFLWHPSLGMELGEQAQALFHALARGEKPLDIFVFEGTVIRAPGGTGRYNMFAERPMLEWVRMLAPQAGIVVAIGDCACWGGIPAVAPNPSDSTGLQFHRREPGGFLGTNFRSKWGLPVINIPGCPAHPDWITQIVVALATGRAKDIALDELNRPKTFFTSFTQTGKTRAGMPCTGCTEPEFPFFDLAPGTVFKTQKISGTIPKDMPAGLDPISYMGLAAAARVATPQWAKEDMFVV
jgi:Ni,Fe-hydrogenase I small subunit